MAGSSRFGPVGKKVIFEYMWNSQLTICLLHLPYHVCERETGMSLLCVSPFVRLPRISPAPSLCLSFPSPLFVPLYLCSIRSKQFCLTFFFKESRIHECRLFWAQQAFSWHAGEGERKLDNFQGFDTSFYAEALENGYSVKQKVTQNCCVSSALCTKATATSINFTTDNNMIKWRLICMFLWWWSIGFSISVHFKDLSKWFSVKFTYSHRSPVSQVKPEKWNFVNCIHTGCVGHRVMMESVAAIYAFISSFCTAHSLTWLS